MASKFLFLGFTWALALLLSFLLRIWGAQHPLPFLIRPNLVLLLLIGPSLLLGVWLLFEGFVKERVFSFFTFKDS